MIVVQLTLLKVALDNRAPGTLSSTGGLGDAAEKGGSGVAHTPFQGYRPERGVVAGVVEDIMQGRRPYGFWRWRNSRQ